MEPPEDKYGRTFVEVMSEKYSPDNFPLRRGPGMAVVVVPTPAPQGSPVKDRLNLPIVLVLNSCGISRAGDRAEIAAFCAHVIELDLSHNNLQDWHEVPSLSLSQYLIPIIGIRLVIFCILLIVNIVYIHDVPLLECYSGFNSFRLDVHYLLLSLCWIFKLRSISDDYG